MGRKCERHVTEAFSSKGSHSIADNSIDNHHLLLVGAGPGLGMAVARRFAEGGYRVTLMARSTDGLRRSRWQPRRHGSAD